MLLFRQFVNDDLGCAAYLVGDQAAGVAVLVDPPFETDPVLAAADEEGVRIERVLETHTHADHVSGHGRLALEHGAPVAIHSLAEAAYPHEPLTDGQELAVGDLKITVLHTPGHRPEHCAFLVGDSHLLTGDSMFIGDAARPDLAIPAREGAQDLFGSLERLAGLPGDVAVYPGHVAGSLCGTRMSPERSSTIAAERASNAALAYRDVQEFVLVSASVSTPRPPTTERVVDLNRGPWVGRPAGLQELPDAGSLTVLDVRPFEAHAAGHAPQAISVPVDGGSFGTKAGFVLTPGEEIVLHAETAEQAHAAAWRLWAVGIFDIAGYVLHPDLSESLATVAPDELREILERADVQVVDVREAAERDEGYLAGSTNIPYRLLRKAGTSALQRDRPVVTVCESGSRAGIAASLLQREGFDVRAVTDGGIADFAGDVVAFRRCGA